MGMTKSKYNKQKFKETDLIKKDENQMYGKVMISLGDCRLKVLCEDGKSRICTIRGKLRKSVWIREKDIILISLRQYDDFKADVLHKYSQDQIDSLIASGELKDFDSLN